MKRNASVVAMLLLASSAVLFAANGNGPGSSNPQPSSPGPQAKPMEQNMFGESEGKPEIAGDGIQNSTQVDNPSDIGNENSSATDSPEPVPTVGDVGIQNSK